MDSVKYPKKRNCRHSSHSSSLEKTATSQQHKPNTEDREEEDSGQLLCQLESHLNCMKNRMDKSWKRKEKHKKKKKKRKSPEAEMEGLSAQLSGSENVPPLWDCSNKKSESRKRAKKREPNLTQSFSSKKKYLKDDVGHKSTSRGKKAASKNQEVCHQKRHLAGDSTLDEHHMVMQGVSSPKNKSSERALNGSKNGLLRKQERLNDSLTRSVKVTFAPKHGFSHYNKENQRDLDESNIPSIIETSTKPVTEDLAHGRPCSTAGTRMQENDSDVSLERSPKLDDLAGFSEYSQDLFVTQKTYQPSHVLSSNSCDSPPPGQKQVYYGLKSHQHALQDDSQISTFTDKHAGGFMVSQCPLESIPVSSVMYSDKTTQTGDVFSYLALMSVLKRVKTPETCSEVPLDLCLPNRARATDPNTAKTNNDVILVSVKSPAVLCSYPDVVKSEKLTISQLRKMDGRFVQSLLNSSYFFKGKGENNSGCRITPLLKQKVETKRRAKKCAASRSKKELFTASVLD